MNEFRYKPFEDHINDAIESGKAQKIYDDCSEKTVYRHPDNPNQVIGIYKEKDDFDESLEESAFRIKARYYLTQIAHEFLPDNFPVIHLAASKPHAVVSDFVEGKHLQSEEDEIPRINELSDRMREIGVPFDSHYENFIEQDGNLKFVDTLNPWDIEDDKVVRNYSPTKIMTKVETIQDDRQRDKILASLQRLEELYQEEVENLQAEQANN